ncbi:MAG: hypothetical protein AB1757_26075 [Acidobacteriota bacterium]
MKKKSLFILFTLFYPSFWWLYYPPTCSAHYRQNENPNIQRKDWKLLKDFNFPLWLVAYLPPPKDGIKTREVFLYLEPSYFNEENIRTAIKQLSPKFRAFVFSPYEELQITIFSDKEMIERAVKTARLSVCFFFDDSEEGKRAAKEYYDNTFPLKSGYFRAYYYWKPDEKEQLIFSPDPNSEKVFSIPVEAK